MTLVLTGDDDGMYSFTPGFRATNFYGGDCDSEIGNCDGNLWYRGKVNTSSVNKTIYIIKLHYDLSRLNLIKQCIYLGNLSKKIVENST